MPPLGPKVFRNFDGGVNTAMAPDNLPANVSPWGRNAVLTAVSGQNALPSRRSGFRVLNQAAITNDPEVTKIVGFNWMDPDSGSLTPSLFIVTGNTAGHSQLHQIDPVAGGVSLIATEWFYNYYAIPDVTIAQNCAFFCTGEYRDRWKLLKVSGSFTLQPWGLETPSAPTATETGSGSMTGEYEIAVSFRNANSGAVSNRSPSVTVTASAQTIVVTWSTTDTQVTHAKVHLRKTGLNAQFFEAIDTAVGAGTTTLDLTDVQLNQLVVLSPSETEHGRPPVRIRGSCWHLSRMFVFDETNLYWSGLGAPEQFNPEASQPINPKDGGKIVTIVQVHDSLLLILKTNSTWGLYGTSPEDWELRVINPGIGCRAQFSAHVFDGKVAWWAEDGPVLWDQQGPPIPIGRDLLGPATSDQGVNSSRLDRMTSVLDVRNHRVIWAATRIGESQNGILFPFNIRMGVWESHEWDPFEIAAFGTSLDSSGVSQIYAGSPYGRVFEFGSADTDGSRSLDDLGAALTLSGSPTASTVTSLTDGAANFDTDGSGLAGLYVYVVNAVNRTVQRRRIASNTATILTTTPNWDSLPTANDTYYIGSPMFEWDTRWEDWNEPFTKKRFSRLYAQVQMAAPGSIGIDFDVFTRLNVGTVQKTVTLTGTSTCGYWDQSLWDLAYFELFTAQELRAWIGRTGRSLRIRTRYFEPKVLVTLLKIGMEAIPMSGKR